MAGTTLTQVNRELNTFFVVVLMNIVFGALAMAFPLQAFVSRVAGLGVPGFPGLLFIYGVLCMISFGLGLAWIIAGSGILKGIIRIRRETRQYSTDVPADLLTAWIVRATAHYRENRERIRWMVLICALGGCAFFGLGVANLLQGLAGSGGIPVRVIPFLAAGINLVIGAVCLRSAVYFRKYSAAWERRIDEVSRSEDTLVHVMEN